MSREFWKTKKFKELQKEWYKKLDATGFNDIERHPQTMYADSAKFRDKEIVSTYYSRAWEYLQTADFHNAREEAIWYLYCEGYSIREMTTVFAISKSQIARITQEHCEKAGLVHDDIDD